MKYISKFFLHVLFDPSPAPAHVFIASTSTRLILQPLLPPRPLMAVLPVAVPSPYGTRQRGGAAQVSMTRARATGDSCAWIGFCSLSPTAELTDGYWSGIVGCSCHSCRVSTHNP